MIVLLAIGFGAALVGLGVYLRWLTGWSVLHQRILGTLTVSYGMWLALGTGSVLKLVVPGVGALGSAAGAGLGFATFLAVGVVGVVTGGVGIAFGALYMTAAGAIFGAVGGAAGISRASAPLISPFLWAPVLVVGAYFLLGLPKKKRLKAAATPPALPEN